MPDGWRSWSPTLRGPTGRSTVRKYCVKTLHTMPSGPVRNMYGQFRGRETGVGRASDEDALMIRPAREGAAYWVGRARPDQRRPSPVWARSAPRASQPGPVGAAWRPRHRPVVTEKFPAKYCHLATKGGD